jgi:hypothetical protein
VRAPAALAKKNKVKNILYFFLILVNCHPRGDQRQSDDERRGQKATLAWCARGKSGAGGVFRALVPLVEGGAVAVTVA